MKKARASLLLVILVLSVVPIVVPVVKMYAISSVPHRYITMGGIVTTATQLGPFPATWSSSPILPLLYSQNVTFGPRNTTTGVVYLTVPHETYVGMEFTRYDENSLIWYRIRVTMEEDGYGWLFTGNGTSPILGDVDCYTFNNNTGSYWLSPSPKAGELAALPGALPSPGPDGVAGTADDGFGDGTADPVGSSILFLPATLNTTYWDGSKWATLFVAPWPQVFTTATAYDIVIEPTSEINGANSTEVGHPCEFLAGLDNPGKEPVPHGHPNWNAYVTYVSAWSVLEIDTPLGWLDVFYEIKVKEVRDDLVIADIDCNELVDIVDVVIAALAFEAQDDNVGPDGVPETGDDKKQADPNYDARGDVRDPRQLIDIIDIVRIAIDFGKEIEP